MAKMNPSKLRNVLEALPSCNLSGTKKEAIATIITKYLTGDIVPVVRCKDCNFGEWWQNRLGIKGYKCDLFCADVNPEHFCSYGERVAE